MNRKFLRTGFEFFVPKGFEIKDLTLPFLIVVMILGIVLSSLSNLNLQRTQATLIEASGRQRMFVQRIRQQLRTSKAGKKIQSLEELRRLVLTLKNGGQLDGIAIPAAETNEIREALADQVRLLKELDDLIATGGSTTAPPGSLTHILDEIYSTADHIVALNVQNTQAGIRKLFFRLLALSFGLAGLALALNRLIIDRKYRLRELAEAKDEAVHASEAKSLFLANMSHEIRTPLNAIIGMSEILNTTELNTDQSRYVKILKRAGDTLLDLINDILDISKIESGQVRLDEAGFNLTELVHRVSDIMAFRAHQKGLELICYIDPRLPKMTIGDANRIRQILMNLLGNAIKFTASGEVVLRVESESASVDKMHIRFSVSDTGIGIPESKFSSIFDKFVQADATISSKYGGTGLGLSICKTLIEIMSGDLEIKSQVGVGSTFSFVIPLRIVPNPTDREAELHRELMGLKVLIVDDNSTNRLIIRKYLADLEPKLIEEARNGVEAIDKMRTHLFDVVLLDYRMPGMNGLDVARAVKKESLNSRGIIMLLTSDGPRDDQDQMGQLGVVEHMIKPIYRNELLDAMSRSMQNKVPQESKKLNPAKMIRKLKILIVDDVEDNRFVIKSFLRDKNYHIEETDNGEDAIRLHKANSYDIILMDLRMSPIDGFTAISSIRDWEMAGSAGRTSIVAVTAHAMQEEIDHARRVGADLHLTKPVTKARLFSTLDMLYVQDKDKDSPEKVESSWQQDGEPIDIVVEPFLRNRLPECIRNRKRDILALREALDPWDEEEIKRISHNISGIAGMYGMHPLGELGHRIELCASRNDRASIASLIDQMANYLNRVRYESMTCI